MTYDSWKTRSPDDGIPDLQHCVRCNAKSGGLEDEFGDFVCEDCLSNEAEAAYERQCEDFYGGGGPIPLREQQIQALKLK